MSNPKLTLDDVISVINSSKIPDAERNSIIRELNQIAEENKAEKEENKVPKAKSKFVIMIKAPAELKALVEQGGYIIQVKDEDKTDNLYQRIQTAARSHNDSCKRAKNKVSSLSNAMEFIKRKFSKGQNYLVKTKLPVEIQVISDDKIV